jgi:hypothetical protein
MHTGLTAHALERLLAGCIAITTEQAGSGPARGAIGRVRGTDDDVHTAEFSNDARPRTLPHDACAQVQVGGPPARGAVCVVFSAVVGSRAQGLATDESDTDRRGFYVAGPAVFFSIDGPPAQLVHDNDQLCYWEAGKCLRLALQANPTVLEALYSPVIELCPPPVRDVLDELRSNGSLLSRSAAATFRAYADSQFGKLQRGREGGRDINGSLAMHLVRVLRLGEKLLRTGEFDPRVPPEQREALLGIKGGETGWDEVTRLRDDLSHRLDAAADRSPLPDEPDRAAVNDAVIRLRRWALDAPDGSAS